MQPDALQNEKLDDSDSILSRANCLDWLRDEWEAAGDAGRRAIRGQAIVVLTVMSVVYYMTARVTGMNMWFTFIPTAPMLLILVDYMRVHAKGGIKHIDVTGFHILSVVYLTIVTIAMFIVNYCEEFEGKRANSKPEVVFGLLYYVLMPFYTVASDYMGFSARADIFMTGLLIVNNVRIMADFFQTTATVSWLWFTTSVATVQCTSLLALNLLLVRALVYRIRFPRLLAFKIEFKPTQFTGAGGLYLLPVGIVTALFHSAASITGSVEMQTWVLAPGCWFGFMLFSRVDVKRADWGRVFASFNFGFTIFVLVKALILSATIFHIGLRESAGPLDPIVESSARFVTSCLYWSILTGVVVCIDYLQIDPRVLKYGLLSFVVNTIYRTFIGTMENRGSLMVGGMDIWALYVTTHAEFTVLLLRVYKCKVMEKCDFYEIKNFVRPTVAFDDLELGAVNSRKSNSQNSSNNCSGSNKNDDDSNKNDNNKAGPRGSTVGPLMSPRSDFSSRRRNSSIAFPYCDRSISRANSRSTRVSSRGTRESRLTSSSSTRLAAMRAAMTAGDRELSTSSSGSDNDGAMFSLDAISTRERPQSLWN
eukprot:TRINITY_DN66336_c7_g8_i2.p1 TRINITY_DN66336_c7_g8~~TRINITY_DN66336_c7_g8_i2.p1  ORF type:complete len:592 (+),score=230.14 TRINITY_DN66336_c7_g8_i2:115-1890(+)